MSKYYIPQDRIFRHVDVKLERYREEDLSTEEAKDVAKERIAENPLGMKWSFWDVEPYYARSLVRVIYVMEETT